MVPAKRPPTATFVRFCECLNRVDVDYVVVGSEAVAFHGVPRYSLDFDVFLRPTRANLFRANGALELFGLTDLAARIDPEVWARTRATLRLGEPPLQIDLLLQLSGVEYEQARRDRRDLWRRGCSVRVLARPHRQQARGGPREGSRRRQGA